MDPSKFWRKEAQQPTFIAALRTVLKHLNAVTALRVAIGSVAQAPHRGECSLAQKYFRWLCVWGGRERGGGDGMRPGTHCRDAAAIRLDRRLHRTGPRSLR